MTDPSPAALATRRPPAPGVAPGEPWAPRVLCVLLGFVPSVLAFFAGGYQWYDRAPALVYLALVVLAGFLLLPPKQCQLSLTERNLYFAVLGVLVLFWALDVAGATSPLGGDDAAVMIRRNAWEGTSHFVMAVGVVLCCWLGQALVRSVRNARELIIGACLGAALFYAGLRALSPDVPLAWWHADKTSFLNRNNYAHFLALNAVFALGLALSNPRERPASVWDQILCFSLCGAFTALVLSTQSRGGVLSLGVVLALILVVVRARAEDNNRWLLIGVGVVLLLGAVFGLKPFLERVRAPNQDGTGEVRRAVWGETLRQTLKRPVIGVGPGNFTAAFNQEQRISRYYQYEHAEQGYLTVAYEFGLPFLLGSLALLGLAIWHAVQQRERAWRACLLTVLPLLVFLIHNFLDTLVRIPATLCVLALAVAFSRGFTGMTRMDIEKMSDRRPLLPIALALLVLFAAAYGTWMRGLHARTMANLDRGRLSVGVPLAGTFLKWSWDEFHALTEISMALQRQLEATGAVDPAAEELVLRCGDALAKRQPAGWQSWYLYGWSRLYAGTDPEQAIRGLRNAVTCLPRWNDNNTSTVTKVLSALGRYGGQTLLNGFYKQLNAAEREALWPPVYDHILLYPTATLTWAAALAPTGEDRARIIHEVFRRGQSQVLRNTLERIWSNDQLPEEDRLVAGRALAGTVKAEEFLAGFPLDLQSSLPATLLRVDRMIAVGRTNEAATRLAALVPDPTDVPPSQQREVAGVLLKLGDQQRAYDLCVSAAKRRTAVLAASQRQRTVRERFLAGDPALARETLTTAARRNPADAESALDLATFLVETQDPGAAIRVLDSLPAGATVDQKGEAFYLRSRVAEAAGDLGEAARQLMSLLAVTPVPINQPR